MNFFERIPGQAGNAIIRRSRWGAWTCRRAIGFCCGAAVGGIIGGVIGFRINRKIVRKACEILEQIEELQKES